MAALSFVAAMLSVSVAQAHHVMDGQLPTGLLGGLLSGLGHPVIGPDHLAFVLGVGLMLALSDGSVKARLAVILAFVGGTVLGTGLHLAFVSLPASELIIAMSVLGAGVLLLSGVKASGLLMVLLCMAAGLFHGYAYGESVVGAQSSALAAYIAGFAIVQAAIIAGVQWLITRVHLPVLSGGNSVAGVVGGGGLVAFGALLVVQQF